MYATASSPNKRPESKRFHTWSKALGVKEVPYKKITKVLKHFDPNWIPPCFDHTVVCHVKKLDAYFVLTEPYEDTPDRVLQYLKESNSLDDVAVVAVNVGLKDRVGIWNPGYCLPIFIFPKDLEKDFCVAAMFSLPVLEDSTEE